MFKLDLKKRSILIMLFALFSTFYSQAQSGLTINTQPVKLQRICVPSMPTTPRLQVAAVTCGGATLTYQWQRLRPTSIGGTGLFEDISTSWPGYTGANTPTIDITVADSIMGIRSEYQYRCYIVSSFPCYGTATTNVSQIVGVRKPVVKYLTPVDTAVCESYAGSDSKYPLRARIIGLSKKDSVSFTWRAVDMPGFSDAAISAHPNYSGWISTWTQTPDTLTLIKYLTLNQANSTTILKSWDQSKYYLQVNSPACGISDSTVVPKRQLTVHPVPNLSVTTPTINICRNGAFTMAYNVTNATHDAARAPSNINWSINLSGDAGLINLMTGFTTGNGDGTTTINVGAGNGLSVGTHTVTITSIVNTSDGSICGRTLSTQDITVNVYPNPTVKFIFPAAADTSICQASSGIIKFQVDSAMFGASPVAWTVTVTDPSTLLAPATLSGVGNQIVTNTIPTTLSVGPHTVTLTGISTSGTPSTCVGGVIAGADTKTIKVYPKPIAVINTTATANLCLGTTTTFTITVSNAEYPIGTSIPWELTYTDATGSTLPGSPLSGSGNGVFGPYTTSAALTQGSYNVTLGTISLTGGVPSCPNTLTGQTKTVRIYDIPSATLSSVYGTACEGGATPTVNMVVSGAVFNPGATNLAWTITTTGTFKSPTDSSFSSSTALTSVFATTGTGNATYAFTPPTNLAPGRYVINITAISLTNSPACNSALTLTYTLDVFPKPTAAIFGTSMTGNICEGDVVNYSIGVTNAYYGPTGAGNLGWSLGYTNSLGGTIPASPIAGSGNSVLGSYSTSSALLTGVYSLNLSSLTNTTHTCTRTITPDTNTNTQLLRRIYPKPKVTYSTSAINLCENDSSTFDITITNAQRYGSTASADSMQWTLSTTGTFQAAPAGSPSISSLSGFTFPTSGKGNKVITIKVPGTLAAGRYTFTLGNPALASSPGCVGSATPTSVITINIWPKPSTLITPPVDTTCQGVAKTYTVTIGNAYYEPTATAISWDFAFYNEVGQGTSPSYVNGFGVSTIGSGNGSVTYNTAAINAPGTYIFRSIDMNSYTHGCLWNLAQTDKATQDTFKLIVKQRPRLTIVSAPTEVCFNTGAMISYTVDSVAPGQAWSFIYTASPVTPSGAVTISGIGPVALDTFITNPFTTAGAGTISFTPIGLTASGGCASTVTNSTININVAGIPDVTVNSISGPNTICGNAASGAQTVDFAVTVTNMVVGASTKNWKITYKIVGTQDTSAVAGTQNFQQNGLTATGTGNGTFTFTTPNQTYNGTNADLGITDVRNIIITNIEYVSPGTTIFCSNATVSDSTSTFDVNPRPRMTFTPANDTHVCVTSPVILNYTVYGLNTGQSGTLNWTGTNPNSGVQTESLTGQSPYVGTITTANTLTPGYSIQTVTQITNTTTGCAAILNPLPKDTTIVDPPSNTTNLTPSFTVCEGNNSGTLALTGPLVGTVTKWQYSENDGFTYLDFANTDTFYTFTNASLTRRWRVIVKNLTCPADTSNEQIVFVHPQPKVQISSYSSGICQNDSVRFTLSITGVPTNHSWKMGYTKAGFTAGNGTAIVTGTGSGSFSYAFGGMTASAGTGTIQLNVITNDTTSCSKDYTSSGGHLMTVIIGTQSTAGPIVLVASPSNLSLPQTVCRNSNGTLKYSGSGSVNMWFHSNATSGAFPTGWDSTSSTSYTFPYYNIDTTTRYRIRVKFGSCASVVSSADGILNVIKLATATISGSDTICENNTATFGVSLNGEPGKSVTLGWLEGSTGKSGTFALGANPPSTTTPSTITTSNLTTTTSVILQSIQYTTTPTCPQNLYTNAIATVTVNPKPNVTINSVTTPVCQGSTSNVSYTVSGMASTTTWILNYKVNGTAQTAITGTGSGTFNLTTPNLPNGLVPVEMVSIATTNLGTNCTSGTLSGVTMNIAVDATTTPGTVAADVTVCKGGSATVTLTPGTGTIVKWNISTSGASGTYSSVSSSSNTFNLTNLITNTWVTATSKNGVCAEATTVTPVTITVNELPTVTIAIPSGNNPICQYTKGTYRITVGNTYGQNWSVKVTEGSTARTLTGTGDGSFNFTTDSTFSSNTVISLIEIATTSGVTCGPNTQSGDVTFTVTPRPSVTLNSVTTPVCEGTSTFATFQITTSNIASGVGFSVTYSVGSTTGLTYTNTGSGTFTVATTTPALTTAGAVAVTLTDITTTGLTPNCNSTPNGQTKNITVDATSVAGTVSSNQTVCKGTNSGSVSVSGQTGSVVRWEYSTNSGASWTSVSNTTTSLSFSNLTVTTQYRAFIKNSSCAEVTQSTPVTITVNELPTVTIAIPSGNNPICQYTKGTYRITVGNTYGQNWSVKVTEGSTARTLTGTGDGSFNFTTDSTFSSNTVISLIEIATTSGVTCGPNTQSGDVTFTVTPRPSVTLNSVTTPVCEGTSTFATFQITTSNIASGVGFSVTYSVGSTTGLTYTNTGSGTFTVATTTPALTTAGAVAVTLTDITTTGLTPNCNSTPNGQTKNITVDATSVAGTVSSNQTVCKGTNSGSVSVSGQTGSVVRWEYSTNSGASWTSVSNTTTSLSFSNLTVTTQYRAFIKNSSCAEVTQSTPVTITVNELPTVTIAIPSGNNPICQYTKGTYRITVGNTYGQNWSVKVTEGSTARTLTGTGDGSFNFTTDSTFSSNTVISLIEIATTSGVTCGPNTQSGDVTFTVTPRPSVTLNSVTTPVCEGTSTFATFQITTSNIASGVGFSVTYSVGSTTGLTYTNTGSGTFTVATTTPALTTAGAVAVTLTDITTTGLTPNCNSTPNGQTKNITVDATSVAGTVSSNQTVCKGTNSGSVSVSGQTGSVVRWEYSTNSGASWTSVSNTTTSLSFSNLTVTTQYRAFIKNSSCAEVTQSTPVTITVNELPTVTIAIPSGNNPICQYTKGTYRITVGNTYGQNWSVKVTEGSTARTLTGTGDGSFNFTTDSTFSSNTVISLIEIATTSGVTCGPNTQSGDVTFTVTPRPSVTLNSVTTPVCEGTSTFATFQITTSNIASGVGFSVTYSVGSTTGLTYTNTGSGTFTVATTTPALTTAGAVAVTLTDITTTGLTPNCNSTPNGQTKNITVDATSVAGTVSSNQTVCKGTNSGSVSVSGQTGSVVRWEYSTNSGASWTSVSNTTTSLSFSNLTVTTQYRAFIKNSSCAEVTQSTPVTITVNELPTVSISIGSGNNPICQYTNGTYTVTTGNTYGQDWSVKVMEGATARTLTGTGDGSFNFTTLSTLSSNTVISLIEIATTSGVTCGPNTQSGDVTFTVTPLPNATLNSVNTPVCEGSKSSFDFSISNIATGQAWSMSYTEGGISKTTTGSGPGTYSLNTSNLNTPGNVIILLNSVTITSSTPNCTRTLTGATDTIVVDATTVAGTISGAATVCKGSNNGTLTYSGGNGTIVRWEYSINGGSTWSATGTTATTYDYSNITQTTSYRVIVKNSSCLEATSAATTITVREQPTATIGGSTTICQGTSTTLTIVVSNSYGNPWSITYLEGITSKTFTGSGDGSHTLTTGTLSSTTDITLESITLTHSGTTTNPACGPNTLSSTATVNVTALPTATLNSVVSPICQGNTSSFSFTVSNVATGQGWSMSYTEEGVSKTTSGNGPGTYSLTTSTLTTAGTVTITLNSISTTGLTPNCTRTLTGQTMDITVNATTTVGTLGTDVTVCKNTNSGNLSYNVGSSNGAVVRWESSVISAAGPWTSITNTTNSQAYLNISQTTYYRVVVKNGTCGEKESNVITISVQEIPVATIGGSTVICAGNTATLTVSISNVAAGQRSILNYLEGTTSKTINIFGSTGSLTTSVLNTNTDITMVSVTSIDTTISSVFRKGCSNTSLMSTATVNVNALPTATLTSVGGPICQGNSTSYVVTVTNVPTGQGWNLTGTIEGVSISPAPSGTGSGTFTFTTPVLNTPGNAEVKFTLVTNSTTGCTRALSESKNIRVDATTTVGTVSGAATVCKLNNAGSLTYSAGSSNGTIVRWEYSTVSPTSNFIGITNTSATQTYSNLSATTYYRAIVKNGECAEVASNVETITVRDLPSATIASSQTICEGTSANFTITVTNTFGQTFRVYYMIGSKLDSLERTGDGTYTLNTGTLTSSISITLLSIKQISGTPQCSQTLTGLINITVNELPKATYTSLPNSVCQGNKITFTFDVSKVKTTQNWTLTYSVNAPSSGSAASESTSGSGAGSFTITTTATVLPTTSTLTLGTITNTTTGCSSTLNDAKVITVDPTTVGGTVSSSATVCKGSNSGTLTLSGNTGSVVRWEYSINGGSTWTTINNTNLTLAYSNITQTTVYRAFVQSGVCSGANSGTVTITVNELPTATVTNTTICASNTANLSVTVGNTYGQSWTLTFAEGSTTRTLTGTGDGTFTLTTNVLTATTVVSLKSIQISTGSVLCSNTLTGVGVVTVNALPTVSHDTAPQTVCDGSPVDFTVNINDVVAGQSWTVNYKINSGATNTKSGTGPGNFTITSPNFNNTSTTMRVDTIKIVSITNTTTGCNRTVTLTRTIEVYPKSIGGTTSATVSPLCANSTTTSDITVTGIVGKVVRWEYSDDNQTTWTVLSNINNTITVSNLSKTREYRAVVQSGPCLTSNSTITKVVVIPTVDAQISGAPQICAGKTAVFNVLVSNIASTDNWSLTYRVNGTLQTPMTGKGPGNYPLTVGPPTTNTAGTIVVKLETITNTTYSCANNNLVSQAIAIVNPNPVSGFTFANSCKDSVAVFNNTSTISSGTIASYSWNFGDGSLSKDGNPTHAYVATGNYAVSLLAISAQGCRDSITKTITVNPRPVAGFTFKNTCQDTAVKFVDGTSIASGGSIKSYFWEFGDGSTSSLQNPSHSYATAGTFTVRLTVVSNNGCGSVKEQNVTIYTLPEPNYVANPVCQNSAMSFINTSSVGVGSMTYKWDFAGQGNSTLTNPTHTFTGFGSFNVLLTATSSQGCVKSLTKSVTVWANPIANFTVADVCIGETSRFVNTSGMPSGSTDNIQENFWSFGDSTFSTGKDPLHTYAKDGIFSVTVRATSDKGCVNSVTKTAVVHPLPVVTITTPKSKFCDGDSSVLTANAGMRQYEWSLGGVVVGTNQTVTANKQGWYKVKIWAPSTLGGCSNEDSIFITVWPLPTADAGRDTIIDKGQSVILNGKGAGLGGSYSWSPATYLNNAAIARPTSKPDETILYTLTVTDRNGCIDADSVNVTVKAEFVLIVHNVITPLNPDGLNDTWIIDNIEAYPTAEVAVFNRYGMEVFKTKGYLNQWDGTDKLTGGNDLPDGAYYYVITMEGTDKVYKGAISLVRGKR
jgi:gliding motility-associated-like protein